MRTLTRWKQPIKFKRFIGSAEGVDTDGYKTGEMTMQYGNAVKAFVNVSAGSGKANETGYGMNVPYDKVLCTTEDLGINEQSVLWIDDLNSDKPEYVVRRVARSVMGIYSISIAKIVNG